ATKAAR
nr:Chain B, H3K23la peptide [Homo sapiens]